jgi:hypothetical protein
LFFHRVPYGLFKRAPGTGAYQKKKSCRGVRSRRRTHSVTLTPERTATDVTSSAVEQSDVEASKLLASALVASVHRKTANVGSLAIPLPK